MQESLATSVLQLIRRVLALIGALLLIAIGSHAMAQADNKAIVRGTAHPTAKVRWTRLFTY